MNPDRRHPRYLYRDQLEGLIRRPSPATAPEPKDEAKGEHEDDAAPPEDEDTSPLELPVLQHT
jgi:hypothetical protein